MNVIGYRKGGIAFLYIVCLLLTVPLSVAIYLNTSWFVIFFPIALAAICIYVLIGYFKTPHEAIIQVDDDTIEMPKVGSFKIADITSVSYNRARAKNTRYKWGSVTVNTRYASYKVGYIADCEEVADEIIRLAERSS